MTDVLCVDACVRHDHYRTDTGLCVNADTYEEAAAEAATAGPPTSGGAEGGGEPAPADAPAEGGADEEPPQLHRPFDVSVLGRYDFRLRPTNFVPGFKRLRASAILDYVRACVHVCLDACIHA